MTIPLHWHSSGREWGPETISEVYFEGISSIVDKIPFAD